MKEKFRNHWDFYGSGEEAWISKKFLLKMLIADKKQWNKLKKEGKWENVDLSWISMFSYMNTPFLYYDKLFKIDCWADLSGADLENVSFEGLDLYGVDFRKCKIRNTNFSAANLSACRFSNEKGLLTKEEFLSQFEKLKNGWLVYKVIKDDERDDRDRGWREDHKEYKKHYKWEIKQNSIITGKVDHNRFAYKDNGINFGTLKYCNEYYRHYSKEDKGNLWACELPFDADICVPYASSGNARTDKLKLITALS